MPASYTTDTPPSWNTPTPIFCHTSSSILCQDKQNAALLTASRRKQVIREGLWPVPCFSGGISVPLSDRDEAGWHQCQVYTLNSLPEWQAMLPTLICFCFSFHWCTRGQAELIIKEKLSSLRFFFYLFLSLQIITSKLKKKGKLYKNYNIRCNTN